MLCLYIYLYWGVWIHSLVAATRLRIIQLLRFAMRRIMRRGLTLAGLGIAKNAGRLLGLGQRIDRFGYGTRL